MIERGKGGEEMRTEFDIMGRSESRDGWRAMSAVGEGDRVFLRCGLEPNRWGLGVFFPGGWAD